MNKGKQKETLAPSPEKSHRVRKVIITILWVLFGFGILTIISALIWAGSDTPSFEVLENTDNQLSTQVFTADNQLLSTYHNENRIFVDYEDIDPTVVQALIATEDLRFYEHSGIDFESLARVIVKTLLMSDSGQGGGSTITQQLAKNLYTISERRQTAGSKFDLVGIKLKEWITAVKLERSYTKEEIITMYLNTVEFSGHSFGIHTAAKAFFGKTPSQLTAEESAMLVGMVNKPTRYNPVRNPGYAKERRDFVLGQMTKAGFLTEDQRDSLRQIPINLSTEARERITVIDPAPYFMDMLKSVMRVEEPVRGAFKDEEEYLVAKDRWDHDDLYGWLNRPENRKPNGEKYNLFTDGLRIYTTIDSRMQKYAEQAVVEHLSTNLQVAFEKEKNSNKNWPFGRNVSQASIDRVMQNARRWSDRWYNHKAAGMSDQEILRKFSEPVNMTVFTWKDGKAAEKDVTMTPDDSIRLCKSILRSAMMAIEPNTGYIRAYVGGPDYKYFKYDNVRQGKRQVGSTVKPFLYSLAMESGDTPCTEILDIPQHVDVGDGQIWSPRSTDPDKYIGMLVSLKWGLTMSSNNISAALMGKYHPQAMIAQMRKMGITSHLEEVSALCLGAADLSVYEMVSAYNTFPSKGNYMMPLAVTRIEDKDGNVLATFTPRSTQALNEVANYEMVDMMQSVVNHGTGGRLRRVYNLKVPIGGKTGTTNYNSNGWFIGYTPKITAGVWTGGEDPQVRFTNGALGQGANMALPIWGIFLKKCLADRSLGFSDNDAFYVPPGQNAEIGCLSVRNSDSDTEGMEEDYM